MPRPLRADVAHIIYHVINRANGRLTIFKKDKDYQAFINTLSEAKLKFKVEILAFCIMPNHWHLVLKPLKNGELSNFMRWLTMTHSQRWHVAHNTVGIGHIYQGRYKSFPVETDKYFIQLAKYVERNPLRANLVKRAQDWHWSSLWIRENGDIKLKKLLDAWPIELNKDYINQVNLKQDLKEEDKIKTSLIRNRPLGKDSWIIDTAKRLHLESSLRNPGRPKKNGS